MGRRIVMAVCKIYEDSYKAMVIFSTYPNMEGKFSHGVDSSMAVSSLKGKIGDVVNDPYTSVEVIK